MLGYGAWELMRPLFYTAVSACMTYSYVCIPCSLTDGRNYYLIFGLIFETCLAVLLAYCPGLDTALKMYGLRSELHV